MKFLSPSFSKLCLMNSNERTSAFKAVNLTMSSLAFSFSWAPCTIAIKIPLACATMAGSLGSAVSHIYPIASKEDFLICTGFSALVLSMIKGMSSGHSLRGSSMSAMAATNCAAAPDAASSVESNALTEVAFILALDASSNEIHRLCNWCLVCVFLEVNWFFNPIPANIATSVFASSFANASVNNNT